MQQKKLIKNLIKIRRLMIYLVLSISLIILLFIYGCKPGDNNYSVQDEEYLIGHIVRNVDDNTPEVIDFRNNRNELAVYNYTFAYPAYNPEYYVNALWFFEPMASFSSGVAFNNQIAGALNRIYYIFADNRFSQTYNNDKWDFLNKNQINYLNKNDLNIADEIKNEFDQRYLDVSFYENDEFKEPDAGEIQEFTVGKAPYKITNLLVNKGADSYRLSWYSLLVYANKGKAFLERSVFFPNFILDYPYYTIFKDGAIMVNNNLTDEYGNWISPLDYKFIGDAQGTYKVNLHIPTLYPVFEQIDSEYEFSLPQQDAQPPILNLIDIPARFEANKELNIRVNVLEVSGLKQFRILYSRNNNLDDAAWLDLPVNLIDDNNDGNNNNLYDYNASIIISSNSDNFEKINLRIIAIDNNDNKVSSTIKAASLKAREVNFGLKASKTNAARGDSIIFSGECKDDIGNGCKGLRIGYYIDEGIDGSNEKFLDADMTKFQRLETYDDEYRIIDYTYEPASFTYPWQVPINYDKSTIKFKLKFDGTGVYLPKEESVTINIGAVNYDIALTDLTIKNFEFNKEAKINVTVTNVGISKAENIDVKLQIDARVEDTKTIQSLEPNQAVNVSFSYIPKKAGSTAIIVASNYLKDENLDNNNQKATRDVQGTGSDVAIRRKDYSGLMAINDTKFLAYLVKNFGQSKAENISLKVYDLFDGQYIWLRYNELNVIVHKGIEYRITAQQTGANNNEVNLSFEYISGSTDVKENFALKDDVSGNGPEGIYILKNGIGIVYLGVYNDGIGIELANLAYLEKNIADLDELEQREENITWDTKIFGWHNLFSFVNVSNDIDYTNNVRSDILRVVEDKPDLIITEFGIFGLDHNNYAVLNNEYNISVRILNDGIRESDEFDAVFTDFYDLTYAYVNEEETRGIFIDGKEYRIAAKINYSSTEPIKSNVELEIRYEDAVERLTLRLGEVKVLGNGKNIALQFISPNTARMSFGSAKHHLVRIPKIKPNEYYEISGLKWKPNKTGEHRLISNLNTTYDYDTSNNVNEIWKSVARDLPDLDITKNTEED
ncbi:hypothetical protein HYU06_05900, partial [Candidatus Woesearchaeota archaeon]|nr:hypothetical protein [Candidatus Woesearchaeota archaeon]